MIIAELILTIIYIMDMIRPNTSDDKVSIFKHDAQYARTQKVLSYFDDVFFSLMRGRRIQIPI